MSETRRGIVTLIMCLVAAIAIVLGVLLWRSHFHTSGLFMGFGVGIACTVVVYYVRSR
jgi:hypothetical protein